MFNMTNIMVPVIIFIIYSLLTFYLGWNLKKWLQASHLYRWPIVYWIVFYILAFSSIIGRLHDGLFLFDVIGNYWMFIFEYGLLLCIVANIIIRFTPLKKTVAIGWAVIGLLVVLFLLGTYNAYSPVVRNAEISVNKEGEPLRVVVASDFHLGILSNKNHLQKFVQLANETNPDVVLLVGDIVDDDPKWFAEDGMGDVMKQLNATYGVYGVLGNHDYYGGEIPLFIEEMKEADVNILMDETILVGERFYLTGQEDVMNPDRKHIGDLKPENTLELPWIVMNHTPDDLNKPAEAKVDLHLSGHTHHGQMWPNNYITERIFELDYGHKLKSDMHALVSSGYGFWGPPIRIGSRSELWVVDITFTKKSSNTIQQEEDI